MIGLGSTRVEVFAFFVWVGVRWTSEKKEK